MSIHTSSTDSPGRPDPGTFDGDFGDVLVTAYHEAGHVLVRLAQNRRFVRVIAVPVPELPGENLGGVVVERVPIKGERAGHDLLVETVAGRVAEMLLDEVENHGRPLDDEERTRERVLVKELARLEGEEYHEERDAPFAFSPYYAAERAGKLVPAGPGSDYHRIRGLVDELHGHWGYLDPVKYLRDAELEADLLLRNRWDKVDRLARSLARRKKKSMSYREVCRLLGLDPAAVGVGRVEAEIPLRFRRFHPEPASAPSRGSRRPKGPRS